MTEPLKTVNPFEGIDPNKGRSTARLDRIRALAELHAVPRSSRAAMGLPLTDKVFADQWGVNPDTLTRDKKSKDYSKFLEEAKEKQARQVDPRGTAAISETKLSELANDDFATYEQIKGQLAQEAMAGDQKALELWLKRQA